MFLGLPEVTSTDPASDPSKTSKNSKKNLDFLLFCYFFMTFYLKNYVNVPVFRIWIRMFLALPDPHPNTLVRGTDPRIRIRNKCHGSQTLVSRKIMFLESFFTHKFNKVLKGPTG
jgi:hypothetical protein